jgi:hypothetical protein
MVMETERRIASAPVRSATETSSRLLEFAGAWGGAEKVGDLTRATPILRALILDRVLQKHPLLVEYGPHTLRLFCSYEDEALDIEPEDEELPSHLPHPVGQDISWTLIVPCPDGLRDWATVQAKPIGGWFIVAGSDGTVPGGRRSPDQVRSEKPPTVEIDTAALQRLIDHTGQR